MQGFIIQSLIFAIYKHILKDLENIWGRKRETGKHGKIFNTLI